MSRKGGRRTWRHGGRRGWELCVRTCRQTCRRRWRHATRRCEPLSGVGGARRVQYMRTMLSEVPRAVQGRHYNHDNTSGAGVDTEINCAGRPVSSASGDDASESDHGDCQTAQASCNIGTQYPCVHLYARVALTYCMHCVQLRHRDHTFINLTVHMPHGIDSKHCCWHASR